MRVALISMILRQDDFPAKPRGELQLVGQTLALRQLAMALDLGCERVICLTDGTNAGQLELQHAGEKRGAHFHLAQSAQHLSGLVRAADELFVFEDGIMLDHAQMAPLVDERRGVLVVSADEAVPAGFERIDASSAWAGVLRTGGDAIEKLTALPPDIDPIPALLRIALQSGTRTVVVPDALLADGSLAKLESAAQAVRCEDDWFSRHFHTRAWTAPGNAFADRVVGRFARKMFARGLNGVFGSAIVVGLILTAVLADWLGGNIAGFIALSVAALHQQIFARLSGLTSRVHTRAWPDRTWLAGALIDLAIILIPALPLFRGVSYPTLFAGLVLIGVLRLIMTVEINGGTRANDWTGRVNSLAGDRVVLILILALAAWAGFLLPTLQLVGLLGIGLLLFRARLPRLTQT